MHNTSLGCELRFNNYKQKGPKKRDLKHSSNNIIAMLSNFRKFFYPTNDHIF